MERSNSGRQPVKLIAQVDPRDDEGRYLNTHAQQLKASKIN